MSHCRPDPSTRGVLVTPTKEPQCSDPAPSLSPSPSPPRRSPRVAPAALAKGGDRPGRGVCTQSSTAKLKLSGEDGRIEVEFEVDQNRNGVPWKVTLRRNGSLVASATATTRAPSGSFSVRRVTPERRGADRS